MANEPTETPGAGAADDGVSDGDFLIESASAPALEAPADTTSEDRPLPDGMETAEETQAEPQASPSTAAPTPEQGSRKKNKSHSPNHRPERRVANLQSEIDKLTFTRRQIETEVESARRELAALRSGATPSPTAPAMPGRVPAPTGGASPESAAPGAGAPPVPVPPKVPDYKEFYDDAEYDRAVKQYEKDLVTYHQQMHEHVAQQVLRSVDERLGRERLDASLSQAEQAYHGRLQAAREAHADDWNERAANLEGLQSSWYNPARHGEVTTPFLSDIAMSHPDGPEMMHWLGGDLDRAQALADLLPNRPIRDAIMQAPPSSLIPLLEFFASDQGAQAWEQLRRMPPQRVYMALGQLTARVTASSQLGTGGPVPQARPTSRAVPPAKPPRGAGSAPVAQRGRQSFDEWMAEEDRREAQARQQRMGLTAR